MLFALDNLFGSDIKLRFNKDSFCALIVKYKQVTALVYNTGKIVIIGGKIQEDINNCIEKILHGSQNVL